MTEQLTDLLQRYADDMAAGHSVPPPLTSAPSVPQRPGSLRRIALPVLAAASVAAVAAAATMVGHSTARPAVISVAAGGDPVPAEPGDTPPPPPVLFPDHVRPGYVPPTPPPGRDRLNVSLELPAEAITEQLADYTVVIGNPSSTDVSLDPCPAYLIEYGGQQGGGRLPCEQLPPRLAPGQTLRIGLSSLFGYWDGPDTPVRDIDVAWAIAGPAAARGHLTLKPLPLGDPLATAPFSNAPAPPGEPVNGVVGLQHGMKPEWRLTPTIIEAPETVRAGEMLRYTVRLVNVDPKQPVPLRPCRGFTQWLQRPVRPAGEQVAFLDWSFERGEITSLESDEHSLNCDALPAEIPPRRWVQLKMELKVPSDYPPGPTSLAWKVGELDVFGSMQSRYVTVTVLPASGGR